MVSQHPPPGCSGPPAAPAADVTGPAITEVQAQIGRVDMKASIIIGLCLAGLTAGGSLAGKAHLHGAATLTAALTAALVVAAIALLGCAVRPALGGHSGLMRWAAAAGPQHLHDDLTHHGPADASVHLWHLARSARRKYRLLRAAVDLLGAALLTACLTAIIAA